MNIEIYTGESLAENLNALGVSAVFVKAITSCTITKYHFNLECITDLTKLNKAKKCLSAILHKPVEEKQSTIAHFCLEIENNDRYFPTDKETWWNIKKYQSSAICFGYDENMEALVRKVEDLPHMLVAGTTGSGKSIFLNNVILDLHYHDDGTALLLIDPKQTEFSQFKNSHRLWMPIITSTENAIMALNVLCDEMDARYKRLADGGQRDNSSGAFYKIVCIIDELADLMLTSGKQVEEPIVRLAQKGRACGIHLILATQRPTVNVVTGLIKANIPTRVAFATASNRDSITLLDRGGAEKLLGKGDCLVKLPDRIDLLRIQTPLVTTDDIKSVMPDYPREWKNNFNRKLAGLEPIHAQQEPPRETILTWFGRLFKRKSTVKHLDYIDTLNNIDCIDDDEE